MSKTMKIVLIILAVIVLAIAGFLIYLSNKITDNSVPIVAEPEEAAQTAVPLETAGTEITPEPTLSPEEQEKLEVEGIYRTELKDQDVLNILLLGCDVRRLNADTAYSGTRSDTVMVASFNFKTDTVTLVSFLRDSYIQIRGSKGNAAMNKLNSAFANGGISWLINTLNYKRNYDLDIQYYVGVGFRNFEKLIDAVGGIEVEMTAEECEYVNWRCAGILKSEKDKSARFALLAEQEKTPVEEFSGVHLLNGEQALWYTRDRTTGDDGSTTGSDFTRTSRQQNMLMLVYDKVKKGITLTQMKALADLMLESTYTNLPLSKIIALGYYLMTTDVNVVTTDGEGEHLTMPRAKSWSYETLNTPSGAADVITFSITANRKYLHELLYGSAAHTGSYGGDPVRPTPTPKPTKEPNATFTAAVTTPPAAATPSSTAVTSAPTTASSAPTTASSAPTTAPTSAPKTEQKTEPTTEPKTEPKTEPAENPPSNGAETPPAPQSEGGDA